MKMAGKNNTARQKGRIIALLTREEMEFLDKVGMDALFSTGHKISRIDVISALVEAAMELKLSAEDVATKEDLVARILDISYARRERRRYPRLRSNLIAGFRRIDSLGPHKDVVTGDIGIGGFKVEMEYPDPSFVIGQPMEITIRDPRESEDPVKALGRVVWMKEKERGAGCEIGFMLTYIRKEDSSRYMRYLCKGTRAEARNK